jgi:tripeptide aminopeptidase
MAEHFADSKFLVDNVLEANREVGIEPWIEPIRGGTDGAELTFRGLPCPNLATGGYNMHSVREFVPVKSLELTVDMLEHLVAKFAVAQEA